MLHVIFQYTIIMNSSSGTLCMPHQPVQYGMKPILVQKLAGQFQIIQLVQLDLGRSDEQQHSLPPHTMTVMQTRKKGLLLRLLLDGFKIPLLQQDEAKFKYTNYQNKNIYYTLETKWERQRLIFIEDFKKGFTYTQSKVQSHTSSSNQTRHLIFKCFATFFHFGYPGVSIH